jgi:hypothetical protein
VTEYVRAHPQQPDQAPSSTTGVLAVDVFGLALAPSSLRATCSIPSFGNSEIRRERAFLRYQQKYQQNGRLPRIFTCIFNRREKNQESSHACKLFLLLKFSSWCPWPESNQHSLRNSILSRARLPIPPQGPSNISRQANVAKPAEYSGGALPVNPQLSTSPPPKTLQCDRARLDSTVGAG